MLVLLLLPLSVLACGVLVKAILQSEYFTGSLILNLAILVLIIVYIVSLFFRKFNHNLILVISFAALMSVFLLMVPPTNYESLERYSKRAYCEKMIEKYHLLNGYQVNEKACYELDRSDCEKLEYALSSLKYDYNKGGWDELIDFLNILNDAVEPYHENYDEEEEEVEIEEYLF